MKLVAVVPARRGSKTIKNKNLKKIKKQPLINYTLREIFNSKLKKNCFIISNDKKIKNLATKYKFNCEYKRPNNLSKDNTPISETLYDFSKWYLKKSDFDAIVMLQATSPLRNFRDINKAIEIFKKGKFDSLFSISESMEHPYETIDFKKKSRKIKYILSKSTKFFRRQDFDLNSYFINGAIYIFKKKLILKKKMVNNLNHGFYTMSKIRSFDINDESDLKIVKKFIK